LSRLTSAATKKKQNGRVYPSRAFRTGGPSSVVEIACRKIAGKYLPEIPIGTLNYPTGTYLTIEGIKAKQDPMVMANQDLCRVERVNGSKLSQPVTIKIDEAKGWSNGVPFVFKGYEMFRMIGTPPAEYFAAREAGNKDFIGTQIIWHLEFYFVVTSVVSPKSETNYQSVRSTEKLVNQPLSKEQAMTQARKLASDKGLSCNIALAQDIKFRSGRWIWTGSTITPKGHADIVTVELAPDGSTNNVTLTSREHGWLP